MRNQRKLPENPIDIQESINKKLIDSEIFQGVPEIQKKTKGTNPFDALKSLRKSKENERKPKETPLEI